MTEIFMKLKCSCPNCGEELDLPIERDWPFVAIMIRAYIDHDWTFNDHWYCPDHKPLKFTICENKHPHYSDYRDYWENRPPENRLSRDFDEKYDPYADRIQMQGMCSQCDFCQINFEDDGSTWRTCTVEGDRYYGHNLWSGHFYGGPIMGRICPYFTCPGHHGRDPEKDRINGIFHVPFNECYDGD